MKKKGNKDKVEFRKSQEWKDFRRLFSIENINTFYVASHVFKLLPVTSSLILRKRILQPSDRTQVDYFSIAVQLYQMR